jgi:hypothetical protein
MSQNLQERWFHGLDWFRRIGRAARVFLFVVTPIWLLALSGPFPILEHTLRDTRLEVARGNYLDIVFVFLVVFFPVVIGTLSALTKIRTGRESTGWLASLCGAPSLIVLGMLLVKIMESQFPFVSS